MNWYVDWWNRTSSLRREFNFFRGKTMGRMRNGNNPSGNTDWETPIELVDALEALFGRFDLDPCATYESRKAPAWFGRDSMRCSFGDGTYKAAPSFNPCAGCRPAEDGLAEPWFGSVFVNPPYGRGVGKWVEKCYNEVVKGNAALVVALLPVSTDTRWWLWWVSQATEVRFLKGRIRFVGAPDPAPFASAIVVWRRGMLGWGRVTAWDWRNGS